MPVSKKPRRKATSTQPQPKTKTAVAGGALPNRRAIESYLAATAARSRDDAIARAQDVMYEAWDRTTSRSRIALADKALTISPLCADADNLLAAEARYDGRSPRSLRARTRSRRARARSQRSARCVSLKTPDFRVQNRRAYLGSSSNSMAISVT